MFGLIILIILVVVISGGLILASNYVASIGELLNMIWNFIVSNMFGFLVLLCCILFVTYLFRKINFEKINLKPDYDQKIKKLNYQKERQNQKIFSTSFDNEKKRGKK